MFAQCVLILTQSRQTNHSHHLKSAVCSPTCLNRSDEVRNIQLPHWTPPPDAAKSHTLCLYDKCLMNCFVLQDLKTRLTEEIGRLQSSVKAQGSKDKRDRTLCELEVNHRQRHNKNERNVWVCVLFLSPLICFFSQVLLRMKKNEIEYLHQEISCLRNEMQFLNTVMAVIKFYCVCVCV